MRVDELFPGDVVKVRVPGFQFAVPMPIKDIGPSAIPGVTWISFKRKESYGGEFSVVERDDRELDQGDVLSLAFHRIPPKGSRRPLPHLVKQAAKYRAVVFENGDAFTAEDDDALQAAYAALALAWPKTPSNYIEVSLVSRGDVRVVSVGVGHECGVVFEVAS